MKNYTNEFKVGLFIVVCIGLLAYITFSTGKVCLKKDGYYVNAVFDEVAGLTTKTPVMLNGLEVGKVENIKISYDNDKTQIVLRLWIDSKARIRENPVVSIKTLGMMGEKYVHIASKEGKEFIKPGDTLNGKPYTDMDAMLEQAQSMAKDISQQVAKLVNSLNSTVDSNKDSVSQIVKNLESTSKNFEEFSSDVKAHPWKLLFKGKEKPQKNERN